MRVQHTQYSLLAFLSIFFLSTSATSQTQLQLILHTNKPIDSLLIIHWTDKEVSRLPYRDTLYVNFKTRGIDFYHLNYTMGDGKPYYVPLFLDTGRIKIVSHIENEKLVIDSVTGSPIYEKYSRWRSEYILLKQNADTAALDSFLLRTYAENIDNLFSFTIGSRYVDVHQNDKLKLYALLPLIATQTKEIKEHFGFSFLNERLLGIIGNDVIRLSDHPLIDAGNQTSYAKTLNAKYVILDFWFVGCLPCMKDHEKIVKLMPVLKKKQVELISISNDESYIKWKTYLQENKYLWQQYKINPEGKNIIGQLGITTYPTYILLDEKGKIIYITSSLEELIYQTK
jgi:thiol-disulfide isomerase/thioredoxin